MIAMAAIMLATLAALVDTAFAKAGEAPPRRRRLIAACPFCRRPRQLHRRQAYGSPKRSQIPSGAMMPTLLVGDHIMVQHRRTSRQSRATTVSAGAGVDVFEVTRATEY